MGLAARQAKKPRRHEDMRGFFVASYYWLAGLARG
jgi:hypothetical protein